MARLHQRNAHDDQIGDGMSQRGRKPRRSAAGEVVDASVDKPAGGALGWRSPGARCRGNGQRFGWGSNRRHATREDAGKPCAQPCSAGATQRNASWRLGATWRRQDGLHVVGGHFVPTGYPYAYPYSNPYKVRASMVWRVREGRHTGSHRLQARIAASAALARPPIPASGRPWTRRNLLAGVLTRASGFQWLTGAPTRSAQTCRSTVRRGSCSRRRRSCPSRPSRALHPRCRPMPNLR